MNLQFKNTETYRGYEFCFGDEIIDVFIPYESHCVFEIFLFHSYPNITRRVVELLAFIFNGTII